MKKSAITAFALFAGVPLNCNAWEATVTQIMHHYDAVAVWITPDPGPLNCQQGQPYLIKLDSSEASKQRFSMILTALTTKRKIEGYNDPCSSSIWGVSRPTIERLIIK